MKRLSRRALLAMTAAGTAGLSCATWAENRPYKVGLTPVFLSDLEQFNRRWARYLARTLDHDTRFVQRRSYREIMELLQAEKLEFAWICGYPYVSLENTLDLLAAPIYKGSINYHSYWIVRKGSSMKEWKETEGRVFAYSDPMSNSGWLYPSYMLRKRRIVPEQFFSRMFPTWAHANTVKAVARGLADVGAVDSYVYESLLRMGDADALQTRVIHRSPPFPQPPFVAIKALPFSVKERFRSTLLQMQKDVEGRQLLSALYLDGFAPVTSAQYDVIREMAHFVEQFR